MRVLWAAIRLLFEANWEMRPSGSYCLPHKVKKASVEDLLSFTPTDQMYDASQADTYKHLVLSAADQTLTHSRPNYKLWI